MKLIEITPEPQSGDLHVKWIKADGAPHRTVIACGASVHAQLAAVNAHLALLGLGSVPAEDFEAIDDFARKAWTSQKRAAAEKRLNELRHEHEAALASRAAQREAQAAAAARRRDEEEARIASLVEAAVQKRLGK